MVEAAAKRPSLIRATARQCTWSFLSAVLPRLALTAFTFAQPFLISTTVEYIGEVQPNETYGKALVGAWTLVFLGLAVRSYNTFASDLAWLIDGYIGFDRGLQLPERSFHDQSSRQFTWSDLRPHTESEGYRSR